MKRNGLAYRCVGASEVPQIRRGFNLQIHASFAWVR